MDTSMPGSSILHYLPDFAQIHVHWVSDANISFLPPSFFLPSLVGRTSLVAQTIKCLPTTWKTWVWSLGWEDPLEKEMTTHSSILAWKIPSTKDPGRLQSMGSQSVRHNWATSLSFLFLSRRRSSATYYEKRVPVLQEFIISLRK